MHISINTLRELIDLPQVSFREIADKLTLAGLEIESIKKLKDDDILELKITPNRPDVLSHIGISRELSAIYQSDLKSKEPLIVESGTSICNTIKVCILDANACSRYAFRIIENVTVSDSPNWLKRTLLNLNIKPVNNIIDAINWTVLKYGHPLNVFDVDRLFKPSNDDINLKIRFAKDGESLITQERKLLHLTNQDLIIEDGKEILSLAGIVNGISNQISTCTRNIFLESAWFDPVIIRKSAKRFQITTDSSYRFERGMDPNAVCLALNRASDLIQKLTNGQIVKSIIDIYSKPVKPREVNLRLGRLAKLSNLPKKELTSEKIKKILSYLGIEALNSKINTKILKFKIPTYRIDIIDEIDLIEEVIRLIGFEKIPVKIGFNGPNNALNQKNKILNNLEKELRKFFINHGFFEVINYSFTSKKDSIVEIKNPLGEEFSGLRTNLFSGLVGNLEYNLKQKNNCFHLFEIGTVFSNKNKNGLFADPKRLVPENMSADAFIAEELHLSGLTQKTSFYDAKGILESLFNLLKINVDFVADKMNNWWMHPGQSSNLYIHDTDIQIGEFGQIHPHLLTDNKISLFEINLNTIQNFFTNKIKFKLFSKFPAIRRDLSLVIDGNILSKNILEFIQKFEPIISILEKVEIIDVYQGNKIEIGKKSITISGTFRSQNETLKENDVNKLIDQLIVALETEFKIELRS